MRHLLRITLFALIVGVPTGAQQPAARAVSNQDLLEGLKDPGKWLMFGGDYSNRRHSPLTQITPQNVDRLTAQWMFQTGMAAPGRGFETTPLVADGMMYITG